MNQINLLFVCSRNQWRSPTAEKLWRTHPLIKTRSAGTSKRARHKVSSNDIRWADIIMVMEHTHQSELRNEFRHLLQGKTVYVLDIADEYHYMDPYLIEELNRSVTQLLQLE